MSIPGCCIITKLCQKTDSRVRCLCMHSACMINETVLVHKHIIRHMYLTKYERYGFIQQQKITSCLFPSKHWYTVDDSALLPLAMIPFWLCPMPFSQPQRSTSPSVSRLVLPSKHWPAVGDSTGYICISFSSHPPRVGESTSASHLFLSLEVLAFSQYWLCLPGFLAASASVG